MRDVFLRLFLQIIQNRTAEVLKVNLSRLQPCHLPENNTAIRVLKHDSTISQVHNLESGLG